MKPKGLKVSGFTLFAAFLLSCASTAAPVPDWAASPRSLDAVYPDSAYIARIGRGRSLEIAEANAAAEIARYFTSRISSSINIRETSVERDGVTSESLEFESAAFVTSEIELFGLRYAPDAFYNEAEKLWQTIAYIDRAEAWAVYEPRFKMRADALHALYEAAEAENDPFKKALRWQAVMRHAGSAADFDAAANLGQALYPQKMNAAFSMTRNEMAALPQKLNEARQNAAVYIDCPLDFESIIVNAFSRAISAEGFPVSKTRSAAAAVCTITVDEGMQKRELGVFYFPSVQAVFAEKGTPLFSYSASADSASAVTPDVAKRRAYKALEEEIQRTFSLSGAGY